MNKISYPKTIDELLRKANRPQHIIVSPLITVLLIVLMFIVVGLALWCGTSWYLDRDLNPNEGFKILSNLLFFCGTILSLWETLQTANRQHALSCVSEVEALIEEWETVSASHDISSGAPIRADNRKPGAIEERRIRVKNIKNVVEADIKFASKAVTTGVFVILAGLALTVFT